MNKTGRFFGPCEHKKDGVPTCGKDSAVGHEGKRLCKKHSPLFFYIRSARRAALRVKSLLDAGDPDSVTQAGEVIAKLVNLKAPK